MGNSCVNGKIGEDGFFYFVSRSIWPSRSPDHMIAYKEKNGGVPCVKAMEGPNPIRIVPPELVRIKPSQPTKVVVEPVIVAKEEPVAARTWEGAIKNDVRKSYKIPKPEQVIMIVREKPRPVEPPKPKICHNVKRMMSVGLQMDSVLRTKTGHLKQYYNLGDKLGNGQYGTTFLCVERRTGKKFACKSIAKRRLSTMEDVDDVRREIEIMHHLSGHPNIISIKGAYEDAVAVHVVMELCTGGELFDRIVRRGHYSEKKAAEITRTIVGVIKTCHSLGVMHRDLKPENFLFVDEEEDSPIKAIDFGLSAFFRPGEIFSDVVGSPFYVAPEVLRKHHGPEADIWSAGIIVYVLLCGVPPFLGESEEEIFEEVLHGDIDFSSGPWPNVSESAKDLVKKMLARDPKRRITAHQVLCHPWVQFDGVAPDKPLASAVSSQLTQFSAMNKLKKMTLTAIAEILSEEEIVGLREMFDTIDADHNGHITFKELKAGLKRFGSNLNVSEIYDLLKAADVNDSGTIEFGEFIAATMHANKIYKDDHLSKAFSYFDKDGSGYITQDELERACEEFGMKDSHLEEMIQEADQNNDGRIDCNEFKTMMLKGNTDIDKMSERFQNFS